MSTELSVEEVREMAPSDRAKYDQEVYGRVIRLEELRPELQRSTPASETAVSAIVSGTPVSISVQPFPSRKWLISQFLNLVAST